jgi:predicted acyl esterase
VFRARFRESFETPKPVTPGAVSEYGIGLHSVDYTFKRGHRIMIQVQSTWFPLIDRNPQTFVPNIFEAADADYQVATQSIHRSQRFPSHLEVTVANR